MLAPEDLQAFHSLLHNSTPTPKKPGNFLTHLLPSIGGIAGGAGGGALGGAAAGSAILPGIGTVAGGLLGALLGGAAGGAGGKVAENALEHQKLSSGVGGQALEQGVLSAGPLRLLRAGKAAAGAGGLAKALGEGGAIDAKLSAPGLLARGRQQVAKTGGALRGEARGIKPGVTQTGTSQRLKPGQSDAVNSYLNGLGTKNSAHTQLRAVESDLKASGKGIGDLVKTHDRPVTVQELADITGSANAKAKNALGLNANDPLIKDTNRQLAGSPNLSNLRQVRSNIDDQLKSFYTRGERNTTTSPAVEKVLKGYRDGIDKVLSKSIPGFREANAQYATGLKAQDLLLKSANPSGFRVFGVQTGVGGEGLQATKDLTGRALSKAAGSAPKAGATNQVSLKAVAKRSLPVGLAQALAGSQPYQSSNLDSTPNANSAMLDQNMNANMDTLSQNGADMSSSTFDPANIEANIQKIVDRGGSMKDVTAYVSLASAINSLKTSAAKSGSTKLSGTQQQQANNAQSGLQALQTIAETLKSNPNAPKLAGLPGGSLISNATGTGSYKAAVNNAADVIGRLRSGGAINQDEEKRFLGLLPAAFDDQQTVDYKLNQLASLFQSFANPAPASSATDLISALGGA